MKSRFFYFNEGSYGKGEEEVRSPQSGEILVKTTKSLVSVGTESHCNTGRISWKRGRHGYSNVGRIEEVGPGVEGFEIGQRIFSFRPHVDYYIGKLSDPWYNPYPVTEGLNDEQATFCTLATVALHAVERAEISVGQAVVVVGQGTVGQLTGQLARLAGAGRLVAVDLDGERRKLAEELGADSAIEPDAETLKASLADSIQQRKAPTFIEACGEVEAIRWMMDAAEIGSRIVVTGSFMGELAIHAEFIVNKELTIVGAHQPKDLEIAAPYYPYSRPFNITTVMDLIARGKLEVTRLYDKIISPDELLPFYDGLKAGKPRPCQPLIDWELAP